MAIGPDARETAIGGCTVAGWLSTGSARKNGDARPARRIMRAFTDHPSSNENGDFRPGACTGSIPVTQSCCLASESTGPARLPVPPLAERSPIVTGISVWTQGDQPAEHDFLQRAN